MRAAPEGLRAMIRDSVWPVQVPIYHLMDQPAENIRSPLALCAADGLDAGRRRGDAGGGGHRARTYPGGHVFYLRLGSRAEFAADVRGDFEGRPLSPAEPRERGGWDTRPRSAARPACM